MPLMFLLSVCSMVIFAKHLYVGLICIFMSRRCHFIKTSPNNILTSNIYIYIYICCDADKRKTRGTQEGLIKIMYIQVTETRYKRTWLNSSELIGSWEFSGVVTIHPLRKWYHTWLCHADWWTLSDALVDVYNNIYIYIYMKIELSVRQWPGRPGSIPGRVIPKTLKMVLDISLLNAQQYKVRIYGKVEQSLQGRE